MIGQLTAQLFQTGTLAIPHVGTFQLEHHPAVLHFADRLVHAPYASISFHSNSGTTVTKHDFPAEDLDQFGMSLMAHLKSQSFNWQGIGTLQLANGSVSFVPEKKVGLAPVLANKVLRENRQHAILVGDREESSADTSFIEEQEEPSRSWIWIAWIVLFLSLVAIGWHFFKNGGLGSASKIHASTVVVSNTTFIRS